MKAHVKEYVLKRFKHMDSWSGLLWYNFSMCRLCGRVACRITWLTCQWSCDAAWIWGHWPQWVPETLCRWGICGPGCASRHSGVGNHQEFQTLGGQRNTFQQDLQFPFAYICIFYCTPSGCYTLSIRIKHYIHVILLAQITSCWISGGRDFK